MRERLAVVMTLALSVLVLGLIPCIALAGMTWDLAGDWSDTTNPNGVWSYNGAPGTPITTHWDDWDPGSCCFIDPQPGWAAAQQPGAGHVPVWLKAVSLNFTPEVDLPLGTVGMHASETSAAGVTWTSPINGTIQVAGGVWLIYPPQGRSGTWTLYINGTAITDGDVTPDDPYTSTNPFDFADGSGGPVVLRRQVSIGDVVNLELVKTSSFGPFFGVNLTISTVDPDHYLSYKIKPSKGSPKFQPVVAVQLSDQFETGLFDVTKALNLHNPADKNGEGIADPLAHLKGYEIKLSKTTPPQPKHVAHNVSVTNQFPQTLFLTTVKPVRLLVPTTKCIDLPGNPCPNPLPPPDSITVDHFKCYQVKITKGAPKFQPILGVTVSDQFTNFKVFDLKKLARLCNPVDKQEEGISNPDGHLMCYQATPAKGQPKHVPVMGIHLSNQLGPEQVDTVKEEELCVPSLKQDVAGLAEESGDGGDDEED